MCEIFVRGRGGELIKFPCKGLKLPAPKPNNPLVVSAPATLDEMKSRVGRLRLAAALAQGKSEGKKAAAKPAFKPAQVAMIFGCTRNNMRSGKGDVAMTRIDNSWKSHRDTQYRLVAI